MTIPITSEQIGLSVLDPVLYGAARAFDYLGFRGQDMLDRVGDGIIQYGVSNGYFQKSDNPNQFVGNIVKFFVQNGYMTDVQVDEKGATADIVMQGWKYLPIMKKLRNRNSYLLTCPLCLANDVVRKSAGVLGERISESLEADGSFKLKVKMAPGTENTENTVIPLKAADLTKTELESKVSDSIGLPVFEAFSYGLAYAFNYLGAQAQLLLDNAGVGIIDFLREEYAVPIPDELSRGAETLASFFSKNQLAEEIKPLISSSEVTVTFKNYRYVPVLRRLQAESINLVACPFTLALRSLLRQSNFAAGDIRWNLIHERDASLSMPLSSIYEQEFDEDKIGGLMDRALS